MGEESIIRPPPSKKAAMTVVHSSRSTGSFPTLNVIHVPRPIAGINSPVDGIRRVIGWTGWARGERRGTVAAARAIPAVRTTRRVGWWYLIKCSRLVRWLGSDERRPHRDVHLHLRILMLHIGSLPLP